MEIPHLFTFSIVWKLRKFTLTLALFWQNFRETNVFTKEITKYLVALTKYFFSESKLLILPQRAFDDTQNIFRQINLHNRSSVKR